MSDDEPLPTPESIVEPSGFVNTGWFRTPFRRANLQVAPIEHSFSNLRKGPLAPLEAFYRRMRLKRWHYTSVAAPQVFFACAIVDAGYIGTAFAYVVDRRTGDKWEWSTLMPLSRGIAIADSSLDGVTRVERQGWGYIELDNNSQRGVRTIDVKLEGTLGTRNKPPLRVTFEIWDWGAESGSGRGGRGEHARPLAIHPQVLRPRGGGQRAVRCDRLHDPPW